MRRLLLALTMACVASVAHADGGHLQMRQATGPFTVSLFTTPDTLAVGPAGMSVMVEAHGSVVLDADVEVTLTPEDEKVDAPIVAHLSHAHATNRLLEGTVIQLPRAGHWRAVVRVRQGDQEASVATDLVVADYSTRRGTVWVFAALPICAIGLFAWVRSEKQRLRRARRLA